MSNKCVIKYNENGGIDGVDIKNPLYFPQTEIENVKLELSNRQIAEKQASEKAKRAIEHVNTETAKAGASKAIWESVAETWAKENDFWIEDYEEGHSYATQGGEHLVYTEDNNTETIRKVNHDVDDLSDWYKNLLDFNQLFPNTGYEIVGFTRLKKNYYAEGSYNQGIGAKGNFSVVVKQNFIPNKQIITQEEIQNYLEYIGFERMGTSNDYQQGDIILGDMNIDNVIKDSDGNYHVIDAYVDIEESETNIIDEETQSIFNKFKNSDKFMKAPNGKKTNLTEYLWAKVRTKSFKDWFGDWTKPIYPKNVIEDYKIINSDYIVGGEFITLDDGEMYKVDNEYFGGIYEASNDNGETILIDSFKGLNPNKENFRLDENGEPMIYYHNTDADFKNFDLNAKSKNNVTNGSVGKGIYFTNSLSRAESYGGKITKEVFLKSKNPYTKINKFSDNSIELAKKLVSENINKSSHPNKEYAINDANFDIEDSMKEGKIPYISGYLDGLVISEILKNEGFDSIIDGGNDFVVLDTNDIMNIEYPEYITINGNKIKGNPIIYNSEVGEITYIEKDGQMEMVKNKPTSTNVISLENEIINSPLYESLKQNPLLTEEQALEIYKQSFSVQLEDWDTLDLNC